MRYEIVSADCHVDLPWLPPDLFTANASPALRERMPHVVDGEKGPRWVARGGADFGLVNGMGSAGREYVPGQIRRSDRMAAEGLYEDGRRGIRRLTDPELRVRDQDRDGVQGEVLYGILGAANRIGDREAATEMLRVYNEWLEGFCASRPERFAGIACLPSQDPVAAADECRRVARGGVLRGVEVSATLDMTPLYDPAWEPLWAAASEARLPVHFHTIGARKPDMSRMAPLQQRQAFACHITAFQIAMSKILLETIYGGVFEAHPDLVVVLGESGIGWIPYVLEHMDLEWEDQFRDLTLTMRPSEYWRRNGRATYQSDPVGLALLDRLGTENVMWGSDFPHPDGVWPDSREFIARETAGLAPAVRRRITCENAVDLYRFPAEVPAARSGAA